MVGVVDVLQDVVKRFESARIDYFLVGSLAAMYYGRPRFTNDVDLVAEIKAPQIGQFEKLFPVSDYYCPPNEVLKDEVIRKGSFNLIHQASGVKIDIIIRKDTDFSRSEFARRYKVNMGPEFDAYIATPEDVIIKKLDYYREGGSEKHLIDIREILAGANVDQSYLQSWITRLGLGTYWEKI